MKCPYCGAAAKQVSSNYVYRTGKEHGEMWICSNYPKCDTHVGCHKGTNKPLGTLANQQLRIWRVTCHDLFDALWKRGGKMSRKDTYEWLRVVMELPEEKAHIGMFDLAQCKKLWNLLRQLKEERKENGG